VAPPAPPLVWAITGIASAAEKIRAAPILMVLVIPVFLVLARLPPCVTPPKGEKFLLKGLISKINYTHA
jgi:hypothetical protein